MRRTVAFLLVAAAGTAGCGEESTPLPRDPLEPYPATGVTRTVELTVKETSWEVGPAAVYNAVTYNGQIPGPHRLSGRQVGHVRHGPQRVLARLREPHGPPSSREWISATTSPAKGAMMASRVSRSGTVSTEYEPERSARM